MLWVNYYSLYCLYQILPREHLEHWRHFVLASRLLCTRQLSKDEVRIADALLLQFCRRFEVLYGPEDVTLIFICMLIGLTALKIMDHVTLQALFF